MSDTLSQAKAALMHAKQAFPESKLNEFSNASYKMAAKPQPTKPVNHEVADVASGLAWKKQQVDAVSK